MAAGDLRGISTYQTYFMYRTSSSGTWAKVIDITSFPDLIPPKEQIDITTLSDICACTSTVSVIPAVT